MDRRTAAYLCLLAGIISAILAWHLLVSAPMSWAAGALGLIGLVSAVFIGKGLLKRGRALLNLWAGALIGGLVQFSYQAVRFQPDADGLVFNLVLALLVVLYVAILASIGYLIGSLFGPRRVQSGA